VIKISTVYITPQSYRPAQRALASYSKIITYFHPSKQRSRGYSLCFKSQIIPQEFDKENFENDDNHGAANWRADKSPSQPLS
jgi:hypothetical protein